MVHEMRVDKNAISDVVPVDIVVATIIVASAFNFKNPTLSIYHVGMSDRNPLAWGKILPSVIDYWS